MAHPDYIMSTIMDGDACLALGIAHLVYGHGYDIHADLIGITAVTEEARICALRSIERDAEAVGAVCLTMDSYRYIGANDIANWITVRQEFSLPVKHRMDEAYSEVDFANRDAMEAVTSVLGASHCIFDAGKVTAKSFVVDDAELVAYELIGEADSDLLAVEIEDKLGLVAVRFSEGGRCALIEKMFVPMGVNAHLSASALLSAAKQHASIWGDDCSLTISADMSDMNFVLGPNGIRIGKPCGAYMLAKPLKEDAALVAVNPVAVLEYEALEHGVDPYLKLSE